MHSKDENSLHEAREGYEASLKKLEKVRATYEQGPKVELTKVAAQEQDLSTKIATCQTEAKAAEEEFKQAFEAAGFERSKEVNQALNRKNDALAMLEELEAALAKIIASRSRLVLEANPQALELRDVYEFARKAYVEWRVTEALYKSAGPLAHAIQLALSHRPVSRDFKGAPNFGETREERRKSVEYIWNRLFWMAEAVKEDLGLPFAAVSLSPLKASELLTQVQRRKLQQFIEPVDAA